MYSCSNIVDRHQELTEWGRLTKRLRGERDKERERETDRQTDRDRQRETETDSETETKTNADDGDNGHCSAGRRLG